MSSDRKKTHGLDFVNLKLPEVFTQAPFAMAIYLSSRIDFAKAHNPRPDVPKLIPLHYGTGLARNVDAVTEINYFTISTQSTCNLVALTAHSVKQSFQITRLAYFCIDSTFPGPVPNTRANLNQGLGTSTYSSVFAFRVWGGGATLATMIASDPNKWALAHVGTHRTPEFSPGPLR